MARVEWPRILAPLLAGLVLAAAAQQSSAAPADQNVYTIVDDGYGLGDCVAQRNECGKAVADAWCESHGHGVALAYGSASEVTGAIKTAAITPAARETDAMVRCSD
ncbi:hypothetical protein B1812_04220 [Methylocystis bryophila]|uniref:Uncharacterized protein n=2 Tax=Methylocystis bryophila TaxID=655015 RepID=A0A1W6N0L1_9HYPH|nr:hypothetical protein B1812_04220 [Methylocystis bryophila]